MRRSIFEKDTQREFFTFWTDIVRRKAAKKRKWRLACAMVEKRKKTVVSEILRRWVEKSRREVRNEKVVENLRWNKDSLIKRKIIGVLSRDIALGLHRKIVALS